ncbi:hypothetical protein, partial [Human papillomavirus 143]
NLIRILSLLLSPAPPHQGHQEDKQTQTPPPRPPPPQQPPLTPRPDSSPQQNSHNKPKTRGEGTDGEPPADQGDRKRSRGDQGPDTARGPSPKPPLLDPPPPGPGPRRSPRLESGAGQQPDRDPEKGPQVPLGEGEVEGGDQGHVPPPPPPPTNGHNGHGRKVQGPEGRGEQGEPGEGAVGGEDGDEEDPPPPPPHTNGQEGSLLGSVASLLIRWEGHFDQLVQSIQDDLEDYWKKLSIPQRSL